MMINERRDEKEELIRIHHLDISCEQQLNHIMRMRPETLALRKVLCEDFLMFMRIFFEKKRGAAFIIPTPTYMKSHVLQVSDALMEIYHKRMFRLMTMLPSRSGKTTMIQYFLAWTYAIYPKCEDLYLSHTGRAASEITSGVRDIMMMSDYQEIFGVRIAKDSKAKGLFRTEDGGKLFGSGIEGDYLGYGAGIRGIEDRFTGILALDDVHNPKNSTVSHEEGDKFFEIYNNHVVDRLNGLHYQPMLIIGHRNSPNDLQQRILENYPDGSWNILKIQGLHEVNPNAIHEKDRWASFHPKEYPLRGKTKDAPGMLDLKETAKYIFHARIQQEPLADGTLLFEGKDFEIKDSDPDILFSFITADTAETEKTYNDPTVFGFFGVYKVTSVDNCYGVHWIDCEQKWLEPKDLEPAFWSFYEACSRFTVKPSFAAVEKKNTGVTLISLLKKCQGLEIIEIERNATQSNPEYKLHTVSSGKINRFIAMQPYIAKRLVSFTKHARHIQMCIEHMTKIKPDNSHRHDDIADVLYDAIRMGLMEEVYRNRFIKNHSGRTDEVIKSFATNFMNIQQLKDARY